MKAEELKLYNRYKNIIFPNIDLIYIGIDGHNWYWFLYKNDYLSVLDLINYGFDPDKIVKDLNLETFIDKNGGKYIKGYFWVNYSKEQIESYLKPILKDKLNKIINR